MSEKTLITYREALDPKLRLKRLNDSDTNSHRYESLSNLISVLDRGAYVTQRKSLRSKVAIGNYNSGPATTIALENLLYSLNDLDHFPSQMQKIIKMAAAYYDYPELLSIKTKGGYAPSRSTRDAIGAVWIALLASTCMYTQRIGTYKSVKGFRSKSLIELADSVGFTFYCERTKSIRVEPRFERAYYLFASEYLYSFQSATKVKVQGAGYQCSYKFIRDTFFDDILSCLPGVIGVSEYRQLLAWSKKRRTNREYKSEGEAIISKGKKDLIKLADYISAFSKLGLRSFAAKELSVLLIAKKHLKQRAWPPLLTST